MKTLRAAGFVIYRYKPQLELLLLQTSYNKEWAPPKGHVDSGETDMETALRETEEEAGICSTDIKVRDGFFVELEYTIKKTIYASSLGKKKTAVYFLGELTNPNQEIKLSREHIAYKWVTFDEALSTAIFPNYETLYSAAREFIATNG